MSDKVVKAITVYVSGNTCNLNCSYCYVKNSTKEKWGECVTQQYSVNHMIKAFSPERIGGVCEITVIGSAETLLERNIIPFVQGLIHQGHIVTIVTNCTLTRCIEELVQCDREDLKNLVVKASLHWTELKRLNLVDVYFNNIKKVIDAGASAFPFLIVCNEYLSDLEEIARISKDYLNATPHCSPCVEIADINSLTYEQKFEPECTSELIDKVNRLFDSKMYEEIINNKKMNPQEVFCYAGAWSFGVDFATGVVYRCHGNIVDNINFYEDINKPFEMLDPIGCSCRIASCCLQYNFFSEGIVPGYKSKYMFGDMIYKEGLISEYVREKLNVRLDEMYRQLTPEEQKDIILKNKNLQIKEIHERYQKNPFMNELIYQKIAEGKKIVIYGSGNNYRQYKYSIGFDVEFLLDSYATDLCMVDGKKVFRPEEIECFEKYFIVISTVDKSEITMKLKSLGLVRGVDFI